MKTLIIIVSIIALIIMGIDFFRVGKVYSGYTFSAIKEKYKFGLPASLAFIAWIIIMVFLLITHLIN